MQPSAPAAQLSVSCPVAIDTVDTALALALALFASRSVVRLPLRSWPVLGSVPEKVSWVMVRAAAPPMAKEASTNWPSAKSAAGSKR